MYGCGQPTLAGFGAALEKLVGAEKSAPVVWINMRQVWLVMVAMNDDGAGDNDDRCGGVDPGADDRGITFYCGLLELRALFQELSENPAASNSGAA